MFVHVWLVSLGALSARARVRNAFVFVFGGSTAEAVELFAGPSFSHPAQFQALNSARALRLSEDTQVYARVAKASFGSCMAATKVEIWIVSRHCRISVYSDNTTVGVARHRQQPLVSTQSVLQQ